MLPEDVRNQIAAHANESPKEEVCGLVIIRHGNSYPEAFRCVNAAADKSGEFRIGPEEYAHAADLGEVAAVYHSHPTTAPEATPADQACAEELGLPFIIFATWAATWGEYQPSGNTLDYQDRPFVFGILDCYTLARDYYRRELQLELPSVYREAQFWTKGLDLWTKGLKDAGFIQVTMPQMHDLILFRLNGDILNHCAVYLGDGLMLHHPSERKSAIVPFVEDMGYYAKHLAGFWRHNSLNK